MKEIGGYIELDQYHGQMLHDDGIKLNCGRNAFAYILKAKKIRTIYMPRFMCNSCDKVLKSNNVEVKYYSIGLDFKPKDLVRNQNEWLYIVNFYGQLTDEYVISLGKNVILDNAQAYFRNPINGIDTLYTCRKFFGVADGAILYTDTLFNEDLQTDESFDRMRFLLGRYERSAGEFYSEYVENNALFNNQPIKKMSKLTENLLHGIDYDFVKNRRTDNFEFLHSNLGSINKLKLTVPEGAFMYPLYIENGVEIRKKLQEEKMFIPTLWPAVFDLCVDSELEYDMAKNILPIPVDQRYYIWEMKHIVVKINEFLGS